MYMLRKEYENRQCTPYLYEKYNIYIIQMDMEWISMKTKKPNHINPNKRY